MFSLRHLTLSAPQSANVLQLSDYMTIGDAAFIAVVDQPAIDDVSAHQHFYADMSTKLVQLSASSWRYISP